MHKKNAKSCRSMKNMKDLYKCITIVHGFQKYDKPSKNLQILENIQLRNIQTVVKFGKYMQKCVKI